MVVTIADSLQEIFEGVRVEVVIGGVGSRRPEVEFSIFLKDIFVKLNVK